MGCEVVSVYDDEVAGVIGYPQKILHDLHKRDYSEGNPLKKVPKNHPYSIYGFTQSYTLKNLFTYTLPHQKEEFFVYASGRFLIIADCPDITKQIKTIMHEDKIIAMDVKDKLCVTGTIGGRVILWDLEFFQMKFQTRLPKGSSIISSISLTSNYVFCTNSAHPKNICFCYDYRTSKLLASASLGSFEPTFKGVGWKNNHHVIVAADGVWFCRYSASQKCIDVIKGMFRIFPKTSMTCVEPVDQTYLISGSVDGYIFLWAHYQCQKVLKAGDECLSEFHLYKNYLIVSSFNHNIRVYSYDIIKKKLDPKNQQDKSQLNNGQITEDFVSVILDSYDRSPLQNICVSKKQPLVYYTQTRNGVMFNKIIPSNSQNQQNTFKKFDIKFIDFEQQSIKYITEDSIWFLSHTSKHAVVKKVNLPAKVFKSSQNPPSRYITTFRNNITENCIITFLPELMKLCLVVGNKVVSYTMQEITENTINQKSIETQMSHIKLSQNQEIINQETIEIKLRTQSSMAQIKKESDSESAKKEEKTDSKGKDKQDKDKQEVICTFEDGSNAGNQRQRLKAIGLIGFVVKAKSYLLIMFDLEYMVLSYTNKKWKVQIDQEYEGKIITELEIEGQKIEIQQRNNIFRAVAAGTQEMKNEMSFLQCIDEVEGIWERDKKIGSLGTDSILFK